jgi:hypothetical protein
MNLPSRMQPLIKDSLQLAGCDEADANVGGVLDATAKLATADTERICYIEAVAGDPHHYAGAFIVPAGTDISSGTLDDAMAAGAVIFSAETSYTGPDYALTTKTDASAPAGGIAAFNLNADIPANVHRITESISQVIFFADPKAGIRVDVTAQKTPAELVDVVRNAYATS